MDSLHIKGGKKLSGEIHASGSKNSALPILFSTLLTGKRCKLSNIPDLQDIESTSQLLQYLGASVERRAGGEIEVEALNLTTREAPYDLVRKMRASVLVLGPLLARYGEARVSLPGGCAIGARPIHLHLFALEKLGAEITLENGYVHARAPELKGSRIVFDFPSVGATENTLMAAALARGESVLENSAREPEITDLVKALRSMGATIEGEGTGTIYVQGCKELHGSSHRVMSDRIEVGTYLAATLAAGGKIRVNGVNAEHLGAVLEKFREAGARISVSNESIELEAPGVPLACDVITAPFPGFPTDMQAQFMAIMTVAQGESVITETVFENRFMHVAELIRLGAEIQIKGSVAVVKGHPGGLIGAPLMATDLRASASLVIAGLCAKGETIVNRIYHLDRGYERLEEKFCMLGAEIKRVSSE